MLEQAEYELDLGLARDRPAGDDGRRLTRAELNEISTGFVPAEVKRVPGFTSVNYPGHPAIRTDYAAFNARIRIRLRYTVAA